MVNLYRVGSLPARPRTSGPPSWVQMGDYLAILIAAGLGLLLSFSPRTIIRFNTDAMERLPKEERSEYALGWWRSRSALLIVRGIGIGMVMWAALASAHLWTQW